jgi:hypothetical protein
MEYSPQQPSSPEISENAVERPEQKLLTTFEKVWKVTTDPESIEALSQSDDYLPGFLSFLTGSLELIPEIPESAAEREMLHAIIDRLKPYCLDPGSRRKAKYDTSRVIPLIGQK